jgi:hypothetical protein
MTEHVLLQSPAPALVLAEPTPAAGHVPQNIQASPGIGVAEGGR